MKLDIRKWSEEAKERNFEVMPVGKYNCYVFDVEARTASTGNPMVVVTLKVATGQFKGRQLWVNCVITPNAWWKFQEVLDACEYDVSNIPEVETAEELVAAVKEELVGSKVVAAVVQREWNGETRNEAKKITPGNFDEDGFGDDESGLPF